MARKQERMQNAKRARASRAGAEASLYEVPANLEVREETYPTDLVCGCRIVQRLVFSNFALAYFTIVWAKKVDLEAWEEQYSCDTGHGHFHEHVTGHRRPNDARNLRPLYSHVDVQECFDRGYDLVQDRHDRDCGGGY